MVDYNPRGRAVETFDASFSPVSIAMTAHYIWVSDETGAPEVEHLTLPVIGALVRHYVDASGEVADVDTVLAVQLEPGSQSLIPAMDYSVDSENMGFIGAYPNDAPPSDEEIARAARNAWGYLQRQRATRAEVVA